MSDSIPHHKDLPSGSNNIYNRSYHRDNERNHNRPHYHRNNNDQRRYNQNNDNRHQNQDSKMEDTTDRKASESNRNNNNNNNTRWAPKKFLMPKDNGKNCYFESQQGVCQASLASAQDFC
jgi:hypothetical protein